MEENSKQTKCYCGHTTYCDCGPEEIIEPNEELKIAKQKYHAIIDAKLPSKITRLEVINHAVNDKPIGRILTLYKALKDFENIEVSYQDSGRTLKIFLD